MTGPRMTTQDHARADINGLLLLGCCWSWQLFGSDPVPLHGLAWPQQAPLLPLLPPRAPGGGHQGPADHGQQDHHCHVQVSALVSSTSSGGSLSLPPLQRWCGSHWYLHLHPRPAGAAEDRGCSRLLPVHQVGPHPPGRAGGLCGRCMQ